MRDALAVSSFFREFTTIFAGCTKHDAPDRSINKVVRPLRVPDFPESFRKRCMIQRTHAMRRDATWSPRRRAVMTDPYTVT